MHTSASRGFTLVELLISIAIIGILASIVVVNVNDARTKGADAGIIQTIGNMRGQAEIYYDEALSYSGMCDDSSIQAGINKADEFNGLGGVVCVDGDDVAGAWAIEAQLVASSSQYYCVDYTGTSERYVGSTISATSSTADAVCGS